MENIYQFSVQYQMKEGKTVDKGTNVGSSLKKEKEKNYFNDRN